jgi:ribosomal protein S18 acetylase RimI-like enzyme
VVRQTAGVLDLQPAAIDDANALSDLREAAARWLVGRGIRQWLPGEVRATTIREQREQIEAGDWFLHRQRGAPVVALRFLWSEPLFWGEQADDAAYVHGLVIDRQLAGGGLGAAALGWAEETARAAGRTFLRLDHAADNVRLARYYRERGFIERGRREFDVWGPVTLVEKLLGADGQDRRTRKTPEVDDLRGSPGTTGTR